MGAARWGVTGVFLGDKETFWLPGSELRRRVGAALRRPGWRAAEGQRIEAIGEGGVSWLVLGLGDRSEFSIEALERLAARAVEETVQRELPELFLGLPNRLPFDVSRQVVERLTRALCLAPYRFEEFRSQHSRKPRRLRLVVLGVPEGPPQELEEGVERGRAVSRGVVLARDLANLPPNLATPRELARRASTLARRWGARVRIWRSPELERRGCGGILAVGAGSKNPPCLVRIDWGKGSRTVGLVGKGVTFDSGGLSLKPAERMDEMKWDKAGACAILGVLEALSHLPPSVRVRAYLPFAENLPDGASFRPGDIVRCGGGRTVEITNTDAEGRLLLADALAAAAADGCETVVDLATLTGACVVALGTQGAGLFSNSEELAGSLLEAAGRVGERLWRLPLWPEFAAQMRGLHADLRNSGDRWGGACTAAAFLSHFLPPGVHWAHLDIAGPAYRGRGEPGAGGATGYGVALLVEWLLREFPGRRLRR